MICKAVIKISAENEDMGKYTILLQFLFGIGSIVIHDSGFVIRTPRNMMDIDTLKEYVYHPLGDSATYDRATFTIGGRNDDVMDEHAVYDWAIENDCDQFHGVGDWRELLSDLLEAQLNIRTIA